MIHAFLTVLLVCFISGATLAEESQAVGWETLAHFDTDTNNAPKSLMILDQKMINISGFIVPLEDGGSIDTVIEFLLVPDPMACIHVPPPPPNQMIYVVMKKPIPLDMDYRGVTVFGTLEVLRSVKEYGDFGYNMKGLSAEPADLVIEDPFEDLLDNLPDAPDFEIIDEYW